MLTWQNKIINMVKYKKLKCEFAIIVITIEKVISKKEQILFKMFRSLITFNDFIEEYSPKTNE